MTKKSLIITVIVVAVTALLIGGILMWQHPEPMLKGISVYKVSKPATQLDPSQLLDMANPIQLEDNKVVTVEGIYVKLYVSEGGGQPPKLSRNLIKWAGGHNGICFAQQLDLEDNSIVQAKVKVIKTKTGVCSDVEVLNYKRLYAPDQIQNIIKQLSYVCPEIESYINKNRKDNPIKLYKCLAQNNGEFTEFGYAWVPFQSLLVGTISGDGELEEVQPLLFCQDEFQGAVVVNPANEAIEGIYLDEAIERPCRREELF